ERRRGCWWVEDLGSSNGTFVDETRIPPGERVLLKGDLATIALGPAARVTFMEKVELDAFLEKALEAWSRAFGKTTARRTEPSVEGLKSLTRPRAGGSAASVLLLDESPLHAPQPPTRKLARDAVKDEISKQLGRLASGASYALPEDLEKRLIGLSG